MDNINDDDQDGLMPVASFATMNSQDFEHKAGDCAVHGHIDRVLTRRGGPWGCPECMEASLKAERDQIVLAASQSTAIAAARIPSKYMGQKFTATTPAMTAARAMARNFREFITQKNGWGVLVLMGTMGTGKTLLACEFAESLIRKQSLKVRYVTAQGIVSEIQSSYGRDGTNEEAEIEKFIAPDLLIIDEIDAKRSSDNANMLLNEVINRRYNAERPVVIITNQQFENLRDFVGDRVDDRLHENAFVAAFDWPSFRRQ